jgi:hypothetical protein
MATCQSDSHQAHEDTNNFISMGNSALVGGLPGSGTELRIGGFDLEIDSEITEHEWDLPSCARDMADLRSL